MSRFERLHSKLSKACYEKILTCAAYTLLFLYAAELVPSLCAIISYFTVMVLKLAAAVSEIKQRLQEDQSVHKDTLQK